MPRLPIPHNDEDAWGTILNEFLEVAHADDGRLTGVSPVVNVLDHGAVGDGTTDDSSAIQAAIDEAEAGPGFVYVPPTSNGYLCNTGLIIDSSIVMTGAAVSHPIISNSPTQLIFASGETGITITGNAASMTRIENLGLRSQASGPTTGYGIHVRSRRCRLEHVSVRGFGSHGVFVDGDGVNANLTILDRVVCYLNHGDGVRVSGLDANVTSLRDVDCMTNSGWGFSIHSHHNVLTNCHANSNGDGAYRDAGDSNYYLRPYVEGGAGDSVLFTSDSKWGSWVTGRYAAKLPTNEAPGGGHWFIQHKNEIRQGGGLVLGTTPVAGRWGIVDGESRPDGASLSERMYAIPWFIGQEWSIDRAAMRVTAAGDGDAVVRLAIYAWNGGDPSGAPLYADIGQIDGTTTGVQEITGLTISGPAGPYWIVTLANGETGTVPSMVRRGAVRGLLGNSASDALTGAHIGAVGSGSGQTGAIPDPLPPMALGLPSAPAVAFRFE